MDDLGPVSWPPPPIRTDRLVLRESVPGDREAFLDLYASPEVGTYLGGARSRTEIAAEMPAAPGRRPGHFVVDLGGQMIGEVSLRRGALRRPAAAGRIDLGYLLLPHAWGNGYASEACTAALDWLTDALPGEPVMLATQTANVRSMRLAARLGFVEVERFEAWGADQWLGMWAP